ncbi:NAD(P)-dependent oxidoreductase [Nocardia sp. BMG111209]|uniref:NAD(P)-dependent oxidoreductase n=1 Tax=Nocardia sp. BMG111209 TaxID=1160137 RepID=UPI00036B4CFA|nr:NAD(P)-dependent oxidoreductase [Nocardia sp. BMG111209]
MPGNAVDAAADGAPLRVAVLGLGEAGSAFARDLVAAGADVRGYDPKAAAPAGVRPRDSDADAVRDADLVFDLTTGDEAEAATRAALPGLRPGTLWAEANTVSPALKVRLAELVAGTGAALVDVAIMAPVPGKGLRVPMYVSGPDADRFRTMLAPYDIAVEHMPGPVGVASSRKLLRSVVYKGLAAAIVEAMAGARAAGCEDWFHEHLTTEFIRFEPDMVDRFIAGSYTHAVRRAEEMAAAAAQLTDLGIEPRIAAATRDALRALAAEPRGDAARPTVAGSG